MVFKMHEKLNRNSKHEWNKEFRSDKIQSIIKLQHLEFPDIHQTWIPEIPVKKWALIFRQRSSIEKDHCFYLFAFKFLPQPGYFWLHYFYFLFQQAQQINIKTLKI